MPRQINSDMTLDGNVSSGRRNVMLTESDVPVIPKSVIFGNPARAVPLVSPDGKMIAWSAPYKGVLNIWVAEIGNLDNARVVTNSKDRPLTMFQWDFTNNILYYKDVGGNENYHAFRVDLITGEDKDLLPGMDSRSLIFKLSCDHPELIAIATNARKPENLDVKKVNMLTGEIELIYQNDDSTIIEMDDDFNIKVGTRVLPDGTGQIVKMNDGKWEIKEAISADDINFTQILFLDKKGKFLFMQDSRTQDTSEIIKVNTETWEKTLVDFDPKSNVIDWIFSRSTKELVAIAYDHDKKYWKTLNESFKADMEFLSKLEDGEFSVDGMSQDDCIWIVTYNRDNGPVKYFLYDRSKRETEFLFSNRPVLESVLLSRMHPRIIRTKDGLDLVCYVSLPAWMDCNDDGIPDQPIPMVINVHGGPAARDFWGYDGIHQFLTNRGYAVMSVNYRGSYGFGKRFLRLGDGQWGGKMQDDINDAMDWAISQKIAIPDKVCIFGGSYGGYAVLAGMTMTPERFACGVDIVGVSNLITFIKSIPPYWKPFIESLKQQVGGDPDTDAGQAFLKSRSPLTYSDMIQKPLLIGHGFNDPRVKVAESEQIVKSMQDKKIPVTYCLYPDEGHGFARPENKLSFFAIVENFLARNLGGRAEPFTADDFKGSSIEVKAGKELFEGLEQLLPKPQAAPQEKKDK
jgi:dipeptidyl aminopeptidase/acylaminoacyl peptidase